jgi:type III secretion protein T
MESFLGWLQEAEFYILAAGFVVARMLGFIVVLPLFSRLRLTGLLRNGVAIAFAIPLYPALTEALRGVDFTVATFVILGMKEMLVGAALGLVLGVPFWAAEAAGDIVDLQRGSTMGSLIDPMMTHETSPTGTLFAITLIALFLAAGGLEFMLTTVFDSYRLWPIESLLPVFSAESADVFLDLLTRVLTMALVLSFPIVVGLLLSDVLLGFVAKAAPHMNVFAMSLVVKTLVFSLLLVIYAAFLISYMGQEMSFLRDASGLLESLSCPNCRPGELR